jgi:hypothetical protein
VTTATSKRLPLWAALAGGSLIACLAPLLAVAIWVYGAFILGSNLFVLYIIAVVACVVGVAGLIAAGALVHSAGRENALLVVVPYLVALAAIISWLTLG